MFHTMTIAGLERHLPICRVSDELYIGAFVIFGDCELTQACAEELLKRAPAYRFHAFRYCDRRKFFAVHKSVFAYFSNVGADHYFLDSRTTSESEFRYARNGFAPVFILY